MTEETIENLIGKVLLVPSAAGNKKWRAADAHTELGQVGLSHGFVHFIDPKTGKPVSYATVRWVLEKCRPI